MNHAEQVGIQLDKLVDSTDSPVYVVCRQILSYLECNPHQRNLTIGGLRSALCRSSSEDKLLIEGAFALVGHPFQVLDVRYKLYDESIEDVLEEISHSVYMQALSDHYFIDDDGNDITISELNSRIFPYFINLFQESRQVRNAESMKK